MASASAPPSLVELCCSVASGMASVEQLSRLSPRVRARLLHHAILAHTLDEEALAVCGGHSLHLSGSKLSDRGLSLAAAACGGALVELDISRCVHLHDPALAALVAACANLSVLRMSHCRLTDASVATIARGCRKLVELDYSWNGSGVGDPALRSLASYTPQLRHLAICGSRASDGALLALACACSKLASLSVRGCQMLTESGAVAAFSKLPYLEELHLAQWPHLSEGAIGLLAARCACVSRIDVSMCDRLGDAAIATAAGFRGLRRLDCYGNMRLHKTILRSASLTSVCLSGCRTMESLDVVCPALQTLELHNCRELLSDSISKLGRTCSQLTSLDLSGGKMSLFRLSAPRLKRLVLSGCSKLGELQLECPELLMLRLDGCAACPHDVLTPVLAACPKLEALDLSACHRLHHVDLAHPALRRLDLCWCLELESVALDCPRLASIAIQQPQRPETLAPALAAASTEQPVALAELQLDLRAGLDASHIDALLPLCNRLRQLSLGGAGLCAGPIAVACSRLIGASRSLVSLDLSRATSLDDDGLACVLAACPQVRLLDVSKLFALCSPRIALRSVCELRLSDCSALISPDVNCPAMHTLLLGGSEWLREVRVCSGSLRSLTLAGCRALRVPSLECEHLEVLDLSSCFALDADALELIVSRSHRLHRLYACGCRRIYALSLQSASLRELYLSWCSQLSSLELKCVALTSLYAHGCIKLSAPHVECPTLRLLEMQKCKAITEVALPALMQVRAHHLISATHSRDALPPPRAVSELLIRREHGPPRDVALSTHALLHAPKLRANAIPPHHCASVA